MVRPSISCLVFFLGCSALQGSVAEFVQDIRDGLEREGLGSLTFREGIVRIRMLTPSVAEDEGMVPYICITAASRKVNVRELRVVASTGKGWSYPLTPKTCEEVLGQMNTQRKIEGENSFHRFIHQHWIPITRLD